MPLRQPVQRPHAGARHLRCFDGFGGSRALDEARQDALHEDLVRVWGSHNVAKDGTLVAFSDYLLAVAVTA